MKKYYEVEFSNDNTRNRMIEGSYEDDYCICIIAEHFPTYEEVTEFCKKDMEMYGKKYVVDVAELTYEEAHNWYDMENEANFPVLK